MVLVVLAKAVQCRRRHGHQRWRSEQWEAVAVVARWAAVRELRATIMVGDTNLALVDRAAATSGTTRQNWNLNIAPAAADPSPIYPLSRVSLVRVLQMLFGTRLHLSVYHVQKIAHHGYCPRILPHRLTALFFPSYQRIPCRNNQSTYISEVRKPHIYIS